MEQPAAGSGGEPSQTPSTETSEEPLTRHTLATIRPLIINPSTPASLISSILETLTRHLHLSRDPLLLHHIMKLLTELVQRDSDLSATVSQSVRTFLLSTESARLGTDSLDTLASLSVSDQSIDEGFFASVCFDALAPSRLWLLKNAERFHIRPYLLFTILLGFTKDPYPLVRQAALDGLISLSKSGAIEDRSLIEGCYNRAVELFNDAEACVRASAVHTASEWGQLLVALTRGTKKMQQSDAVFIQLSSMVRDLSVKVRLAAFDALGKTQMVSVGLLLQTLSKKVLDIVKESKFPGQRSRGSIAGLASIPTGALVHGLEDEYYQVRNSACDAMQKLTPLSPEFSREAINLLADMLNDDSVAVRLQALETMHQMANRGHLSLKIANMHMFLGSLTDNSSFVRDAVRKVLKSVKLENMEIFRLSIDGLIENLQRFDEDEVEIFSVLFQMGRRHGSFTETLINKVFHEIEPASDGKFSFDSARVSAFLVLAAAAPLCHGKNNCKIPAPIFSYAVTILGRISYALADEVDRDSLLAYLSHCSSGPIDPVMDFKEISSLSKCNNQSSTDSDKNVVIGSSPALIDYEVSEIEVQKMNSCNLPSSLAKLERETDDALLKSMNIILSKAKMIWSLVKLGLLNEVLRTLRACKGDLAIFASERAESSPSVAYTKLYLQVLKLLAQIYVHFLPTVDCYSCRVGDLDPLLGKLDKRLRDMRCRFIGLSKEEELLILGLLLVSSVLRMLKVEICCSKLAMRKLSALVSQIEHLQEEASIGPSSFVMELKKLMCNTPRHPSLFRKTLNHFSLEKFELSGKLKYISAELAVPCNNSENLLHFVRGLPVVIPIMIKLTNISGESRLWLKMMVGEESTQFLFLDSKLYVGSMEFRYSAPLYRTPKALFFTLKISLGMECEYESVDVATGCGGPKHELTFLTPEVDVYLSSARH